MAIHHYYPFGLEMNGAWKDNPTVLLAADRTRFNGKEIHEELAWNTQSYGFRNYQPDMSD
jgi:hypothetical protein